MQPDHIDNEGRNGLITAIGLVLAFALTFSSEWFTGDDPWQVLDIVGVLLFMSSIVMLVLSLYRALWPYRQTVAHYKGTVRTFLAGVILFFLAFISSVVLDYIQYAR